MSNQSIEFNKVSKCYDIREMSRHTFREMITDLLSINTNKARQDNRLKALKDVSFSVRQGEVLGIIGANGAGKTTILRLLAGVTSVSSGKLSINGSVAPLIQVGAGFHPELTGRENIYLNGIILGFTKEQIDRKFDQIVQFAELERFIDTPVKRYSSGMYVRLGFSVAAHVESDILLVDEILSVGDASFRKKCMSLISGIRRSNRTIVFVSHNLFSVETICDRVIVLDRGRVNFIGKPAEAIKAYQSSQLDTDSRCLTSDGTQWNTGEFDITRVELLNGSDLPVASIAINDPLTIRVDWQGKKRIGRPNVSLNLFKEDGTRVCVERSSYRGHQFASFQGEGTIMIQIDRLPLKRGKYTVGIEISDLDTHIVMLEAYHRKTSFMVEDHQTSVSEGIVSLDLSWSKTMPLAKELVK